MHIQKELRCSMNDEILFIRCMQPDDVNQVYVESLNNENKYLETKPDRVTIEFQRKYIGDTLLSNDRLLLCFFYKGDLIGTSGSQAISSNEFSLGIFIFDDWRGRGFGSILVWMACRFLIQEFNVLTVKAGMEIDNHASLKSFLKQEFIEKWCSRKINPIITIS